LPDFSWYNLPKWEKIYQMTTKFTKCPINIQKSSIRRTSKIYPNLAFWFENIPSGNPGENSGMKN
jgi:hypothetical protein